jgi:hypothetical protein
VKDIFDASACTLSIAVVASESVADSLMLQSMARPFEIVIAKISGQ